MRNAATNRGSCQGCGAVQKLPGGVLAKHGYSTGCGFFMGTCQGSGHLPFEMSTGLIATFITRAEKQKSELEAFRAGVLAEPAEGTTEAWVHVYRRAGRLGGGYQWMKVPLVFAVQTSRDGDYQWLTVQYQHPDHKPLERLDFHELKGLETLARVRALNEKRARALETDIATVERYIVWQQKRIAEWKQAPLLPL